MRYMTRSNLLAEGLTHGEIRGDVNAGRLTRLSPGVYAREVVPDRIEHHLAQARCERGILGLESAALLHGLPVDTVPDLIQVIEPGRYGTRQRRAKLLTGSPIGEDAVVSLQDVRCTSLVWTLVELARHRPVASAMIPWEAAFNTAYREGSLDQLRADLEKITAGLARHRAVERLRFVLSDASHLSESPMETRSRLLIRDLGFPAPVQQYEVWSSEGTLLGRTDFAWPDRGVVGEYDGTGKYTHLAPEGEDGTSVLFREKYRQQDLEIAGWTCGRWGKVEVFRTPKLKVVLERMFALASKRPLPVIHPAPKNRRPPEWALSGPEPW